MRNLDPPMIAKNVRFLPYSAGPRTVCMRVELYGCSWKGLLFHYISTLLLTDHFSGRCRAVDLMRVCVSEDHSHSSELAVMR